MKDNSMINMAGTSMGSGVKMCGSQVGKHMGGPKMMGGDEKKNPMKKMPSAHQSNIDKNMKFANNSFGAMKQNMDGTGSPNLDLNAAKRAGTSSYNKAKDLEKKGPYSGIDLGKTSKSGPSAPSKQPKFSDGTRLGNQKNNPRTGEMILPNLGTVPKTLTKKGYRKSKK